ncbi:tigger transposable element-derived protein 1-like [Plakobranchus ocellatus]|uniref:Tigger transposable element-derived protein 1-like n=1 Tax=Plakobranchus ocellatus TaxID=259542 RepID=A0AAV3XU11_9GAST|nr:tigger transposable element-derived protein 1-like [Plakobranchus ocellatus]
MVRNYVRKTTPYDPEDMKKAVALVLDPTNDTGYYKAAAKLYGLQWQTVRDHVKKPESNISAGRRTVLTATEEEELATCLKFLSAWGFGMTRKETQEVVGEYLEALDRETPFVHGVPGPDWLDGFLKRHQDLSCRLPEQMKVSRQKSSANKTIYDAWFSLLKKTLTDHNLLNKPERVYNVDESGFPLDPKRLKVITQKGIQNLFRLIGGSGRETITVQGCARTDGVMLPPYILYAAKNLRVKWTENGPEGARHPGVGVRVKLPSNSTHVLQPLDVGVYGPVKTAWEDILVRFARQNLGAAVNKEIFPSLLRSLWRSKSICAENIKAGFKKCGIMPLDQSQIPVAVYESAEFFDKPAPPAQPSTLTSSLQPSTCSSPQPSTSSTPQPSTSSSTLQPSTSSSPQPSTSKLQPSSAAPTPSPVKQTTIKDFFLKRLTPMLAKDKGNSTVNRQRAIKRQYGESLTSEECVERTRQEEEERSQKMAKKGKGRGKKSKNSTDKVPEPVQGPDLQPQQAIDSESDVDSDDDPDWVPSRADKVNRNLFDQFSVD